MVTESIEIQIPSFLGIHLTDDRVLLKPQPDLASQIGKILQWIRSDQIVGLNIPYLCDILPFISKEKQPETITIGKYISRFNPEKDPCIQINRAQDNMTAYLRCIPCDSDQKITIYDLYYNLLQNGIQRGFRTENLLRYMSEEGNSDWVLAAEGQEPESGEDGEIILHERLANRKQTTHFSFNNIVLVVKDEIIGQKLPAKPGKSGYDITGKILEDPVVQPRFPTGENTYTSESGLTLYAAIDGHIAWDGQSLSVEDTLRVPGDIDYNTGDIDYDGPVHILGDVRSGLSVKASKDIQVTGCVEGGNIYSKDGNILISNGINGFEKSKIHAGGNIYADYIQDAEIVTKGDLVVHRYISRCQVIASGKIQVEENGGLVRGGKLWSPKEIIVNVAGSSACIPTTLMIRPQLDENRLLEIEEMNHQIQQIELKQQRIRRRLDYLGLLEQRQNSLSLKHQGEARLLSEELIANSQQIMDMEDKVQATNSVGNTGINEGITVITIREKIYPGVKFIIGNQELLIQEEFTGGKIQLLNEKVLLRKADLPGIKEFRPHIQNSAY